MTGPRHHEVVFRAPSGAEVRVRVAEDEELLFAGRNAGLELPATCLQGWCTTCAGRILRGTVDQSEALRLYPEDEAEGFVLLCSAYPRSALVIETHQQEPMRAHRARHGLPAPRG